MSLRALLGILAIAVLVPVAAASPLSLVPTILEVEESLDEPESIPRALDAPSVPISGDADDADSPDAPSEPTPEPQPAPGAPMPGGLGLAGDVETVVEEIAPDREPQEDAAEEETAEEEPAPASEQAPPAEDEPRGGTNVLGIVDLPPIPLPVEVPLDLHALPAVGATLPLPELDAPTTAPPTTPERRVIAPMSTAPSTADTAPEGVPVIPVAAALVGVAVIAAQPAAAAFSFDRFRRFLWLLGLPLYTRIAKERLLDHERRDTLLNAIREQPGQAVADLVRVTHVPRNTAVYHLTRLEREGLVSSTREGRTRLYFAPGALEKRTHSEAIAALRHDTSRAIAREIGEAPGLDQNALCQKFGLAPSLAHWHADRLVSSGVVEKRREGRHVRYYPGAAFQLVSGVADSA